MGRSSTYLPNTCGNSECSLEATPPGLCGLWLGRESASEVPIDRSVAPIAFWRAEGPLFFCKGPKKRRHLNHPSQVAPAPAGRRNNAKTHPGPLYCVLGALGRPLVAFPAGKDPEIDLRGDNVATASEAEPGPAAWLEEKEKTPA